MFSEALRILDQNTVTYMVEELQKKVKELEKNQQEKQSQLEVSWEKIEKLEKNQKKKDDEIARLQAEIARLKQQ